MNAERINAIGAYFNYKLLEDTRRERDEALARVNCILTELRRRLAEVRALRFGWTAEECYRIEGREAELESIIDWIEGEAK